MAKDRRGRAARAEAATEQPASNPYPDDIRFRVFRIAGASVHAALEVSDLKYAQELHEDIERCVRLRRREAARRAVRRLLATTDEIIARATPRSFAAAE